MKHIGTRKTVYLYERVKDNCLDVEDKKIENQNKSLKVVRLQDMKQQSERNAVP